MRRPAWYGRLPRSAGGRQLAAGLATICMLLGAVDALASVGKVTVLDGEATRTAADGKSFPLAVGGAIELHDVLDVPRGNLKLELTDGSVIALAEKSRLEIREAEFRDQERSAFWGHLSAGSLWTTVKKALGGGKYEVTTDRAVAGVRGTVFRVDADAFLQRSGSGRPRQASIIRVLDGVVNVHPSAAVIAASKGQVPKRKVKKGPRVQVAGPHEVSADTWENIFVDLQKNTQISVGVDLWEQAEVDAKVRSDAFSQWIAKSQ